MKRLFLAISVLLPLTSPARASEPLPAKLAFRANLQRADPGTLVVDFDIAPGYFLYKKRLAVVSVEGFDVQALEITGVKQANDPVLGIEDVLDSGSHVVLRGRRAASGGQLAVKLKIQGCLLNEVCYPPEVRTMQLL
ncbi:protein-disulfide reductase DsbD N-terminal domain-containing protein (plasmid) [Xanthomonas sontii]|uniref:protein-disulfide reductase DsbD N-terminal domain-containing protein n=1 Tax=Xanthomonas sontii TaxID=2650745 RepID=UPI003F862B52